MIKRLFIILFLAFTLSSCALDPNEQFIQGTWEIVQSDADNEFFQWVFNNGLFSREQVIDRINPLYTTGRYRVLQSNGDFLTLELFDYDGDRISYENNPMSIQIEIDRENNTIKITNILFNWVAP